MLTFHEVLSPLDIDIPEGLVADAEVPVLTTNQRQGDVGIFRRAHLGDAERATGVTVPREGIAVVKGEASTGSHTHRLVTEGACTWVTARQRAGEVTLGVLEVPVGSVAYLVHDDEHGANGIGPGTYELTGKREQLAEIQRVAD